MGQKSIIFERSNVETNHLFSCTEIQGDADGVDDAGFVIGGGKNGSRRAR